MRCGRNQQVRRRTIPEMARSRYSTQHMIRAAGGSSMEGSTWTGRGRAALLPVHHFFSLWFFSLTHWPRSDAMHRMQRPPSNGIREQNIRTDKRRRRYHHQITPRFLYPVEKKNLPGVLQIVQELIEAAPVGGSKEACCEHFEKQWSHIAPRNRARQGKASKGIGTREQREWQPFTMAEVARK